MHKDKSHSATPLSFSDKNPHFFKSAYIIYLDFSKTADMESKVHWKLLGLIHDCQIVPHPPVGEMLTYCLERRVSRLAGGY